MKTTQLIVKVLNKFRTPKKDRVNYIIPYLKVGKMVGILVGWRATQRRNVRIFLSTSGQAFEDISDIDGEYKLEPTENSKAFRGELKFPKK